MTLQRDDQAEESKLLGSDRVPPPLKQDDISSIIHEYENLSGIDHSKLLKIDNKDQKEPRQASKKKKKLPAAAVEEDEGEDDKAADQS